MANSLATFTIKLCPWGSPDTSSEYDYTYTGALVLVFQTATLAKATTMSEEVIVGGESNDVTVQGEPPPAQSRVASLRSSELS